MNEKELLEIEGILNTNKFWTLQSGELLNIMDNLYDEIRRLKEENGNQARELENTEREAEGIHQESQLYKDLYTKVNTQNMVYKVALEDIEQCNGIIDIYDAKKRAFVALEVDTNESK